MQIHSTITILPLLSLAALGCPVIDPASDDDVASNYEAEPDGSIGDTTESDSTGDGDTTDETGLMDLPPAETVWNVYDSSDGLMGELATPAPDAFPDHSNLHAEPEPRDAYVINVQGYGIDLVESGISYLPFAHDMVRFTGPDCTGKAIDFFATMAAQPEKSVAHAECTDAGIDALLQQDAITLHYGLRDEMVPWIESHWPGALGIAISRPSPSQWYNLPVDQPWPSKHTVMSLRSADGGPCVTLIEPEPICAIEVEVSNWAFPAGGPPYHLVEEPAP